jgi:hypothetical protein
LEGNINSKHDQDAEESKHSEPDDIYSITSVFCPVLRETAVFLKDEAEKTIAKY